MANPVAVGALQFFSKNARKNENLLLTLQLPNMQNKELGYYMQSCQVVWITTDSVVKSFRSSLSQYWRCLMYDTLRDYVASFMQRGGDVKSHRHSFLRECVYVI